MTNGNGTDLTCRDEASIDCPDNVAIKLWSDAQAKELNDAFDNALIDQFTYGSSGIIVTHELMKEALEDFEASVQAGLKRPGLMQQIGNTNTMHYKRMTQDEIMDYLNKIRIR